MRRNIFKVDLRDADIVFCYLLNPAMGKLDAKFRNELKKGCKIISHKFKLPGWKAEKEFLFRGRDDWPSDGLYSSIDQGSDPYKKGGRHVCGKLAIIPAAFFFESFGSLKSGRLRGGVKATGISPAQRAFL